MNESRYDGRAACSLGVTARLGTTAGGVERDSRSGQTLPRMAPDQANSYPRLAAAQHDALLGFLGYGNPVGPFWFVGIEERCVGNPETLWRELLVRADHFERIEDLKRAQEHPAFNSDFSLAQRVTTWAIMSKIVLRMAGDPEWSDVQRARQYQAYHLGRFGGETFLADLLPLPANDVADWPYPQLYTSKAAYRADVLPGRIAALRDLAARHGPAFAICYGRNHWAEYRQIFPDIENWEPIDGAASEVGYSSIGTLVLLTPFFRWDAMGHARIERLVRRMREERFTWHDGDLVIEPAPDAP